MQKLLKPFYLIAALLLIALPSYVATAAEIGAPAPAFTLSDTAGNSHSLSDYKGKIVVLEWTNHECPYVRKHYETGNMQRLQQQTTADGVIWLSIVSSAPGKQGYTTAEEAQMLIEKTGAKATARLLDPDGKTGMAYGAKTTPHMYVIDQNGTLVYKGAIDDDPSTRRDNVERAHNYVLAALQALDNDTMPETARTKPYGCAVKYKTM